MAIMRLIRTKLRAGQHGIIIKLAKLIINYYFSGEIMTYTKLLKKLCLYIRRLIFFDATHELPTTLPS